MTYHNVTPHKAANYDDAIKKSVPFYDTYFLETFDLVKCFCPDVRTWLDTGCGTGELVKRAFDQFPNTTFILADPSPDMLAQAQQKLSTLPQSRLRFLQPAGSQHLHLTDARPEVVTAILAHHYLDLEARAAATKRCYNMLAPNGVYVTFENVQPNSERGTALALSRWKRYQLSQGRTEAEVEEHARRFATSYSPIRIEQHLALLRLCGFRVGELLWHSHMQAGFFALK